MSSPTSEKISLVSMDCNGGCAIFASKYVCLHVRILPGPPEFWKTTTAVTQAHGESVNRDLGGSHLALTDVLAFAQKMDFAVRGLVRVRF